MAVAKGKIIVIEGTDKAGKTTQSRMLQEAIKALGKICVVIDFPDYTTPIGMEIRAFLDGKRDYPAEVKHLLFSANRWEKKKEIESMVENGTIIIMNRYWQSNLVYGISNGMDAGWLQKLDKGLPKEDMVLILLVNPSVSKNRAEVLDAFEGDARLAEAAYKNYQKLARQFKWKVLDGSKSKEQVHQEILKTVRKALKV
ncbi:thymidylate kinase [Candidatus Nitrososphaera evergladensis SR1]|uniref:Probable thymidylate kinase n=1 Tax=Candidatus Nitrososphaera evergladensis SR1 TaxID=1459636 RepID=A0A075MQE4_9ARCH|nr:dTMP kinase [Candidatus Nitrososphaera evergladensis]AIF83102.1 thymidylate kinase [Candidatus Nitrososphaera evergladensis SR1]